MSAVVGSLESTCQLDVNTAEEASSMAKEEKTDKQSNFLGWGRIRDLLANLPKKYSHSEAPEGELLENYNCVNENLAVDLDSLSSTSESSCCEDIDGDLLESDWEASTMQPIAELENDAPYEREDWDQELRDSCPYDCDDLLEINSRQSLLYTPNFCEESTIYKPSCHHAEQVLHHAEQVLSSRARFSQVGQYDDADD